MFGSKTGNLIYPPIIYGSINFLDKYEGTVENIASTIIVHEWYSHRLMHYGDRYYDHHLAYENVIKFKELWRLTTDNYKSFVVDRWRYYFRNEIIPYLFYYILEQVTKFIG